MRTVFMIIALFSIGTALSQSTIGTFHVLENTPLKLRHAATHTAILPAIRLVNKHELPQGLRTKTNPDNKLWIVPEIVPDLYIGYDTAMRYRSAIGLGFSGTYGSKWYNRTMVTTGWSTREPVGQTHPAFLPLHHRETFWYSDIRTRLGFTPNRYLHLAAGIDNQFFGEGYRSLFRSDQAAPGPFAMMRVNIWRFEYGLLYEALHENHSEKRSWKFATTHYLSYNVTRNWNIAFLETVFFQPEDGAFKRGFEVEYLNPLVFFRPQEYSIGSSDNILLGLQTSYSLRQHTLYAQLLLDEFVLSEIKNRTRWWANKYGVQLGIKGTAGNGTYRLEGNIMRPYTYAHSNDGQNGGNMGRPLAHPLGSNFAELLAQWKQPVANRLSVSAYTCFQLHGDDSDSASWGGNIYQSYNNRPKEFGHTVGQGITTRTIIAGIQMSYSFMGRTHVTIYFDPGIRFSWGDLSNRTVPGGMIGIRSELFQERKMF